MAAKKKTTEGGIRVCTHAVNRYRKRCFHPRMPKLTARDVRTNLRELIRKGEDIPVSTRLVADRVVKLTYHFDSRKIHCQYAVLARSRDLDAEWDVVTILTEEMFQRSMAGCPMDR